jgi:hypothetical protein
MQYEELLVVQFLNSAGLALLSSILAFMATAYWFRRSARDLEMRTKASALAAAEEKVRDRISDLEMKLSVLTAAVSPISTLMQSVFIKELTHFHTPELDALLVKIEENTLSEEEEPRLFSLLSERASALNGRIPESERDAAIMLPMIMKRVKAERGTAATEIKVVSVPCPSDKEKEPTG